MAYEVSGQILSFISSGNNSGNLYRLMRLSTATDKAVTLVTSSTQDVLGTLQNTPTTGGNDAATVMRSGISKCYKDSTAAAINRGDMLVATTGGGVKSAGTSVNDYIVGQSLHSLAAGTTGILSLVFNHNGRGSSGS